MEEDETVDNNNNKQEKLIEKYRTRGELIIAKLLAQVEPHGSETAGWKVIRDEDNILLSKKDIRGPVPMARVEGRIRANAETILRIIKTLEYDPLTLGIDILEEYDNGKLNVSHLRSKSPFLLIGNRDFSLLRVREKDNNTGRLIMGSTSIITKSVSEQCNFVRGEVLNSGWVIDPIGTSENECFCTFVLCLNPKGWLPSWMIKLYLMRDVFQSFKNCREMAESANYI